MFRSRKDSHGDHGYNGSMTTRCCTMGAQRGDGGGLAGGPLGGAARVAGGFGMTPTWITV